MFKPVIRKLANQFGYDFSKTLQYKHGKSYKRKSNYPNLDYYETPIGNFFFPKNCVGDGVANTMKQGKVFDTHIIDIAKAYIKPGTMILDIGANYGQMSIEFSRIDSSCQVYAFEAQEMVFDILQKNINLNNASNVNVFYNAVYDKNNIDLIFPEPDLVRFPTYGSYGIDLSAKTGKAVKSITIDSIVFNAPVSFMKVDIQGSDLAAMKGAVETIRKYQMPIIFEYEEQFQDEFNTSFQQYVEFVDSIGYRFLKTVEFINYIIVPK